MFSRLDGDRCKGKRRNERGQWVCRKVLCVLVAMNLLVSQDKTPGSYQEHGHKMVYLPLQLLKSAQAHVIKYD